MIGGGEPIAIVTPGQAWIATYSPQGFTNLSSKLPSYFTESPVQSSILTITDMNGLWIYGGYANGRGILLDYNGVLMRNYSRLVVGLTYVDWVSGLSIPVFTRPIRVGKAEPM